MRELSDDEADRLEAATRDDYSAVLRIRPGVRAAAQGMFVALVARSTFRRGKSGRPARAAHRHGADHVRHPRDSVAAARASSRVCFHLCLPATRCGSACRAHQGPALSADLPRGPDLLGTGRKLAGVTGFRFHDYRHDFASKLLRTTGNLRLVQKALNHRDIKTTTRYAHVLDSDVAEAMERVAECRESVPKRDSSKSSSHWRDK